MATTYLQLVNDVCNRVNEVELTSSNFASTTGFHSTAKTAVNNSIKYLGQQAFEWPWFYVSYDETLANDGTVRFSYQSNAKTVDFESFRIQRDDTLGTDTQLLRPINYEEWLHRFSDSEYNTSNTGIRDVPAYVAEGPNQDYVIYPPADAAYTLTYEYYKYPTDLSAHSDTMEYPDAFRQVIVDVSMWYVYLWRRDYENADRQKQHYMDTLKNLRSLFINRYRHVTDTRINHPSVYYTYTVSD